MPSLLPGGRLARLGLLVLLTACSVPAAPDPGTRQPASRPPVVRSEISLRPGDFTSLAPPEEVPPDDNAIGIEVAVFVLEASVDRSRGEPLSSRIDLIPTDAPDELLRSASRNVLEAQVERLPSLSGWIRDVREGTLGRHAPICFAREALPVAWTLQCTLTEPVAAGRAAGELTLLVSRDADGLRPVLRVRPATREGGAPVAEEWLVLQRCSDTLPEAFAYHLPAHFATGTYQSLWIAFEATQAAGASPRSTGSRPLAPPSANRSLQQSLAQALADRTRRWPALVTTVLEAGAPFSEDLVFSMPEAMLDAFVPSLTARLLSASAPPMDGWALDRLALEFLALQEDDATAAYRVGLLGRYVGVLAEDPAILRYVLQHSETREAFEERVRAENLEALGSYAAARRLLAHEWLTAKDAAVPGFDPLAPLAERRLALQGKRDG